MQALWKELSDCGRLIGILRSFQRAAFGNCLGCPRRLSEAVKGMVGDSFSTYICECNKGPCPSVQGDGTSVDRPGLNIGLDGLKTLHDRVGFRG